MVNFCSDLLETCSTLLLLMNFLSFQPTCSGNQTVLPNNISQLKVVESLEFLLERKAMVALVLPCSTGVSILHVDAAFVAYYFEFHL